MRNLRITAAVCGAAVLLGMAAAPAQAARFHVPTIPSFRIGSVRVPVMPTVVAPVRNVKITTPPTAPTVANFFARKR